MTTILSCLIKKAQLGRISQGLVKELEVQIDKLKQASPGSNLGSDLEAAQFVYQEAVKRLQNNIRATTVHADLVSSYSDIIDNARAAGIPYKKIIRAIALGDDADTFKHGFITRSARETVEAYQDHFKARAGDIFEALQPKGFFKMDRDVEFDKASIRAIFNLLNKVDDPAMDQAPKEVAKALVDLHNEGGELFQQMGGNITLSSSHVLGDMTDPGMAAKAGRDKWVDVAVNMYDREFTGLTIPEVLTSDAVWRKSLIDKYNGIVSGGITQMGDYVPEGLRSVVNTRNHHRIFRFKDADSYISYHEQFGHLDLYSATLQYAESIGKDIGVLKALGPKPQALQNALLRKIGNESPEESVDLKPMLERHLRYVTKNYSGSRNVAVDKWLGTAGSARVAGSLGTVVVDAGTTEKWGLSKIAASARGLPLLQTFQQDLIALRKVLKGDHKLHKALADAALYVDGFIDESAAALRAYTQDGGHQTIRQAAGGVMKASGLTDFTNSTRFGTIQSMGIEIGERSWDEVLPSFKTYFEGLGIDENMFNRIKEFGSAPLADEPTRMGVNVQQLWDAGKHEEAIALSTAVARHTEAAAPTISPRFNAALDDLARRGVVMQILSGNTRLFMNYPASFWNNHIRVLANMPGAGKKTAYLGAYVATFAVLGSISTMIKDTLTGKIPQASANTVLRAFARSGIIPILSDFALAPSQGQSAKDLGKRLLGVHGATITDVLGGAKDAFDAAKAGKNPGSGVYQMQRALQGMLPGQNLPVVGLLFQRLVLDQLRHLYDPDAAKKFKNSAKTAKRNFDTEHWWKPGETLPEFLK